MNSDRNTIREDDGLSSLMPVVMSIVVLGLLMPPLFVLVIKFTGYAEVIEEILKAVVVIFLILRIPTLQGKVMATILFGFLFGISENIFYLYNIFTVGNIDVFYQRFFWTVPMHVLTPVIMLISSIKWKKGMVIGLPVAIVIHLVFNVYVL